MRLSSHYEEASLMDVAATQYLFGIRRTVKGLTIDPTIPADWKGYTVRRSYRGCELTIEVKNPNGVQHGVKSMTLDGKAVEGNMILSDSLQGKERARVEVTIG